VKLYGKRLIRNSNLRQIENHSETRDAILWDVQIAQRVCRVKIQGSDKLITARFHQNLAVTPQELLPGNSVKLGHTGGRRGEIEVIGLGGYIPTPVSGDTFPPIAIGEDGIITGCEVLAISPIPQMIVTINAGSYRISGAIYYMGAFGGSTGPMPLGSGLALGTGLPLGTSVAYGVAIDPAPSTPGYFRYDKICVGVDGAVDYVKGTEFTSTPTYPATPGGHLVLATVLTYYGVTAITQNLINYTWQTRAASMFTLTPTDNELSWAEESTNIQVYIKDQYGQPFSPGGTYITISFMSGTGTWGTAEPGVPYSFQAWADNFGSTYTRDKTATPEHSPILMAEYLGASSFFAITRITLLDVSGNPLS
jgi:hypothetical protein